MLTLPIHAELVTPAPGQNPPAVGWLYWVQAWAEDQHHTHALPYAAAEVLHDRDLSLTNGSGRIVAYVAPIAEWPFQDVQSRHEQLAAFRRALSADPAWQRHFQSFVADCRPNPAEQCQEGAV